VTRTADTAGALIGEVKMSLSMPKGNTVGALILNPLPDRIEGWTTVQPGATTKGRLAFEVPEKEADKAVLLVEPLLTRDRAGDQRFLSLR
jgi:hypothetical protein